MGFPLRNLCRTQFHSQYPPLPILMKGSIPSSQWQNAGGGYWLAVLNTNLGYIPYHRAWLELADGYRAGCSHYARSREWWTTGQGFDITCYPIVNNSITWQIQLLGGGEVPTKLHYVVYGKAF